MAEIATYKCSNGECRLTLRLSHGFPVWLAGTPTHLRTLSPSPEAQAYITRYRSESFCTTCKKVVEYSDAITCVICDTEVASRPVGKPCPRCTSGTLSLPRLLVY